MPSSIFYLLVFLYSIFSISNGFLEIYIYKRNAPPALIILLQNLLKLLISSICLEKRSFLDFKISLISLCFFISTLCFTVAIKYLNVFVVSMSLQTKLIFIYVLSNIFVEVQVHPLQIIGIVLIIAANSLSNYQLHSTESVLIKYIAIAIAGNFVSACAYIIFETKIKSVVKNHWDYLFTFTFSSALFNLPFFIINFKKRSLSFLDVFFIITSTFDTVCLTKISFHIKPVQRMLLSIIICVSITFLYNFALKETIGLFRLLCFVLTYLGTFLYELCSFLK